MNETQRALMEGARVAASDEYFGARPQIDTTDRRRVFEAGFDRAWKEMLSTQCDVTIAKHADGSEEVRCGSSDMMRSIDFMRRYKAPKDDKGRCSSHEPPADDGATDLTPNAVDHREAACGRSGGAEC